MDALCRVGGGGLGTNAVNMAVVPKTLRAADGPSLRGFLSLVPRETTSMGQTSPFPTRYAGGTNYCYVSKQIAGG